MVGSLRLQVLVFPLQTIGAGPREKEDFLSPVLYLPVLIGIVEFGVGGPGDLKQAKLMQRNRFGPKTMGGSVRGK